MDWGYLHLVINHFPVVGIILGTLLLAAGLVLKNQGVKGSGLGIVLFSALSAVVTYFTGDPAKDAVERIPEVADAFVNRHEDIATVGMYLMIPAGLLAGMSLYSIWKKERSADFLVMVTLVLSLTTSVAFVYTGRTGGQIRHSEFRQGVTLDTEIDSLNNSKN